MGQPSFYKVVIEGERDTLITIRNIINAANNMYNARFLSHEMLQLLKGLNPSEDYKKPEYQSLYDTVFEHVTSVMSDSIKVDKEYEFLRDYLYECSVVSLGELDDKTLRLEGGGWKGGGLNQYLKAIGTCFPNVSFYYLEWCPDEGFIPGYSNDEEGKYFPLFNAVIYPYKEKSGYFPWFPEEEDMIGARTKEELLQKLNTLLGTNALSLEEFKYDEELINAYEFMKFPPRPEGWPEYIIRFYEPINIQKRYREAQRWYKEIHQESFSFPNGLPKDRNPYYPPAFFFGFL